jgi:gliding motility-associated-like protein
LNRVIAIFFLLLCSLFAHGSHYKAGEITYRLISGLTYEVTLITYTENANPPEAPLADRPQVDIYWGDGTSTLVSRQSRVDLPNTTWKSTYVARHTYGGPGVFRVSFIDPNRIGGINNMDNSYLTPFYVECYIKINPFFGVNSSPILLLPPIDFACVGRTYIHNPGAYDPDGDSLVFSIISPKQGPGKDVFGFNIPQSSVRFVIDRSNGELTWENPISAGVYNIAILIQEFRNGVEVGYVVRDMQITVSICANDPPVIDAIGDTCIEVGTQLMIPVKARDQNRDFIRLTAFGAPFSIAGTKAVLSPPTQVARDSVRANFLWTPSCEHIRKSPFQIIFKAEDQRSLPEVNLVDLEYFNVKVVAPSPKNPTVRQFEDGFILNWNRDTCRTAVGYYVYRRIDSSKWSPSNCETGVPSYTGFLLYDTIIGNENTQYYDNEKGIGLAPGTRYCYRIVAIYSPRGASGEPIYSDIAESYSSVEICSELIKDRPVITNISVLKTDNDSGRIFLGWSKPDKLDSVNYPGPYKYVIYRSEGFDGANPVAIDSMQGNSFALFNDSTYIDSATGLNTVQKPYSYVIEFYSDSLGFKRQYIGKSRPASSVFLIPVPDDQALNLGWYTKVQWRNTRYVIYRWNNATAQYDSIGQSFTPTYRDVGLVNGNSYKYYIKTVGQFNVPGYVFPVINLSQEAIGIPADTTSPCTPQPVATTECELFRNKVYWNNPNNSCAEDVVGYKLYFRSVLDTGYVQVANFNNPDDTVFDDTRNILRQSVAGCYQVTAIDSFGNESVRSLSACVDNCPEYRMPNVFTPDKNDTLNAFFGPFPYRFVQKVNMQIYNRWGQLIFKTIDPDILWYGKEMNTGNDVPDGVYFYVCEVYEYRLGGITKRTLKGNVQLIR